ncbi:MAG: ATP-binding protein, partial [Candidatus Magasanikbacteria bacterium]|nr:ATP-binding protein [Candidatus Magasanikbacteria bacterium]
KVEIKTGDELEDLGNSVNLMIDNLRDSYTNLEKKVSSKTKELADQLLKVSEKNRILGETQKAVVNVLEDIQEEKNYSQSLAKDLLKFQLAVENASDHIIIADPDAKILFANKAAQKITGFNFEEMINNTPSLWGKQMTAEFYKNFWHVIKEEKKQFDGEIINKRKNGESYVAEIHVVPILKDNGDVQFFVGIERDITKAKEVDKSKTEFVSLASHQLRTPLTAISWYIEMLMNGKAGKLKPEQLKYLDEVYKGGQRMRDLVNALLNVSRIDLGTFAIDPEEVDIKEICDSVIAEMEPTILNKKLKVTKKYIEVPAKFVADQKLFRIILQNLISNAVKYTPPKGKVEIKMEKNKKDLLITVADSGYGIPLNQQEKIFSKLFRADNAKIKDPDGTGLGLYIIKSILDHSGGKTWFESEENKGSKFFVSLPLSGMSKKEGVKGLV